MPEDVEQSAKGQTNWKQLSSWMLVCSPLLKWLWQGVEKLGDVDFVVTRIKEPGWIGTLAFMFHNVVGTPEMITFAVGILWLTYLYDPTKFKQYGPVVIFAVLVLLVWTSYIRGKDPVVASPSSPLPKEQLQPQQQKRPEQQQQFPPSGLTHEQIWQLKFASLSLPRPCFVKVTAAPENMVLRSNFLTVLEDTFLIRPQEGGGSIIGKCELREDDRDRSPDSYVEEINRMPQGVVVVNGADDRTVEFLVEALRIATESKLKVKAGTTKPPDIEDTWVYVQIGAGSVWQ